MMARQPSGSVELGGDEARRSSSAADRLAALAVAAGDHEPRAQRGAAAGDRRAEALGASR